MEQQVSCGSVCDNLPTLSLKYPWLVAQNLEGEVDDTRDQIFYSFHDPLSFYRYRIPELLGKRIRGCFHGWVILSNHPHNIMWSLWNPVTSKTIRLPPLTLKDGDFESIKQCCLSSPPDDPPSVLMLTRTNSPTIVFCRIDCKRKRLIRWKEMTYAKQLRSLTGHNGFLHNLTCCNGKVYALVRRDSFVMQVDIAVKDKEVVISVSHFQVLPRTFHYSCDFVYHFLKEYCKELFYIFIGLYKVKKKTLAFVYLFKLDWNTMNWEEMEDLKDTTLFINPTHDCLVFYRHSVSSELGGCIHIVVDIDKVICSYNIKDRTISLSSVCCLVQATRASLWEFRLPGDHVEIIKSGSTGFKPEDEIMVRSVNTDEENLRPARLITLPFDVLKLITEFCVGVEYLNFRVTCKHCQLAAPMTRWSSETAISRLHKYTLVSPWLVVFDKYKEVITFTDPIFGDKYYMSTPQELTGDLEIYCSKYGWLLLFQYSEPRTRLFFFNPFTNDIRKVPDTGVYFETVCFSAPPTSPDCIVVGLSASTWDSVFIYFVNRESSLRVHNMNFCGTKPHSFLFSTFYGCQDAVYALNRGALEVFREIEGRPFWEGVVAEAPRGRCSSTLYFLVKCDRHNFLLVVMDEFGGSVEVFKLNDSAKEWEKIDSLGRYAIYICDTMCLCVEAKTSEMENKIFFERFDSKYGKLVFYSLETCKYHTFNGRNIQQCLQDFIGTKYQIYPSAWIEPSWS